MIRSLLFFVTLSVPAIALELPSKHPERICAEGSFDRISIAMCIRREQAAYDALKVYAWKEVSPAVQAACSEYPFYESVYECVIGRGIAERQDRAASDPLPHFHR